ncbi:MAG: hypothetical protein Q4A78_12695 [Peptostreptococcaceae bacterium]|nr:hypothetical protein [Peptostreptococcaceae bacterium]
MFFKRRQEFIEKMKELEENHEPVELTFREFVKICLAQYSILLPISFGITAVFFLLIFFITKVWYRG